MGITTTIQRGGEKLVRLHQKPLAALLDAAVIYSEEDINEFLTRLQRNNLKGLDLWAHKIMKKITGNPAHVLNTELLLLSYYFNHQCDNPSYQPKIVAWNSPDFQLMMRLLVERTTQASPDYRLLNTLASCYAKLNRQPLPPKLTNKLKKLETSIL